MQPEAIGQLGDVRFSKNKVLPILDEIDVKFPEYKEMTADVRLRITQRE